MKTKYTNLSNQRDKILKDVKTDRINKNIMNSNFRIKKYRKIPQRRETCYRNYT